MKKLSVSEALAAARETRSVEIGSGILHITPRVFREQFGERPAIIVTDTNTFAVAGKTVAAAFAAAGHKTLEPYIFTAPDLYAEHRFVVELETALRQHDAIPVAVGSGTINDLAKLASHRTNRPYMCVATAASMDGYTAFGASITYKGAKQTFTCPAPVAAIADLNVICRAPGKMNAWGYADLISKVPAGADWIFADALGAEPIHAQAWQIVQPGLRDSLSNPSGVKNGETEATLKLIEGLMLGGFAMQAASSSRPASGAEHQFSHLWDMQHHTHNGAAPSHGFKVGIATLAVTALYEYVLAQPIEKLDVEQCCANWPDQKTQETCVRQLFAKDDFADKAVEETMAKYSSREQLRAQLEKLRSDWPQLKNRIREQLLPFEELKGMLQRVGAPTDPEEIGISRKRLRDSFRLAYHIRRRFTILDVVIRTGMLEEALDNIFGANSVWPAETSADNSFGKLASHA
ncbi:MAG: 3-dehydroquinate synthase, partial [Verrucomicrobiales bacterium]|nr:3-dehydroquinate synthase [Verrucomicrobiales bacterium]